jgi:hypothetical protein
MGKQLDRSRPFGEIFGVAGGAKFEQDGCLFNVHGELIGGEPEAAAKPTRKKAEVVAPAEPEALSLLDEQLAAQAEVVE